MMNKAICQSCGFELKGSPEMGTTKEKGIQPLVCRGCMEVGRMHPWLLHMPLSLFKVFYELALRQGFHPEKGKVASKDEMKKYLAILSSLPWWSARKSYPNMRRGKAGATLICQSCGDTMSKVEDVATDAKGKPFFLLCRKCFSNGEFNAEIKGKTLAEFVAARRAAMQAAGKSLAEIDAEAAKYGQLLYWKQLPEKKS